MNFFKQLSDTGIKNVVIEVKTASEGEITVFITPKTSSKDPALKIMKPIFITGTPEEIDEHFFPTVSRPLSETQSTFSNIESFETQKEKASKNTAEKKAAKESLSKEEKAKKDKIDKAVAKVKEIVAEQKTNSDWTTNKSKIQKSLDDLNKADDMKGTHELFVKIKKDLITKTSTPGLFSTEELVPETAEETVAEEPVEESIEQSEEEESSDDDDDNDNNE